MNTNNKPCPFLFPFWTVLRHHTAGSLSRSEAKQQSWPLPTSCWATSPSSCLSLGIVKSPLACKIIPALTGRSCHFRCHFTSRMLRGRISFMDAIRYSRRVWWTRATHQISRSHNGGSAFAFKLICKIIWHLFSNSELAFNTAETFNHFARLCFAT